MLYIELLHFVTSSGRRSLSTKDALKLDFAGIYRLGRSHQSSGPPLIQQLEIY